MRNLPVDKIEEIIFNLEIYSSAALTCSLAAE